MTPPPQISNNHPHQHLPPLLHRPSSLPDIFFTALSLLFLFSSPAATTTKPLTLSLRIPPLPFPQNPRRLFLNRSPLMTPSNPNPAKTNFSSPQCLSDWLRPRLPSDSFAAWGVRPGTKNVHNLWLELFEGETLLDDSIPPVRMLQVVTVNIINGDGRVLVESHQELSDGSVRQRCRPLSEKMKPGETAECAVMRAVREELGSILKGSFDGSETSIVRIVPGSYQKRVEERVSVSYPGLPASYVLHSVDAWVDGLPDGEFCTEEEEEYQKCAEMRIADGAVSVKKHYWKWADPDVLSS